MIQNFVNPNSDSCLGDTAQALKLDPMVFDGSGKLKYNFDSSAVSFKTPLSIRTIFFDASALDQDATLTVNGQISYALPKAKRGFIPLFVNFPAVITFTSSLGTGTLNVNLYNFKIPPIIW